MKVKTVTGEIETLDLTEEEIKGLMLSGALERKAIREKQIYTLLEQAQALATSPEIKNIFTEIIKKLDKYD